MVYLLPKLLNYLSFLSFDYELPDESYSRNAYGAKLYA